MTITEKVHRALKRYAVQRQIFCPITQKVLDIRTAQFSVDADGDPQFAFAPEATEQQIAEWLDSRSAV